MEQSFETLKSFASSLNSDPESYKKAALSLIFCLRDHDSLDFKKLISWEDKDNFYQELILQQRTDEKTHQFLHLIASHQSSNSRWVLPAIAKEISKTLQSLCSQMTIHKNAVLCLLMVREFVDTWIDQDKISQLHLNYFKFFTVEDLSLPYSCLFESSVYHRNVEDLQRFMKIEDFLEPLKLYHLMLIVWVSDSTSTAFLGMNRVKEQLERKDGLSDQDCAAAKSLFVRYADQFPTQNPHILKLMIEFLDESESYLKLIRTVEAERNHLNAQLLKKSTSHIKNLMNNKIYQGVQVIKNLISSRTGFSIGNRLRIAICISGQLRGYRQAFETWKKNLLINADFDVYVHTWKLTGQSGAEPFRDSLPFEGMDFQRAYRDCCSILGFEEVKRQYPALFHSLEQGNIAGVEDLQRFYSTEYVIIEDEGDERFQGFTNSHKMHYKIYACHQFAMNQGKKYDLVVRVRPDLPLGVCGFSWKDILRRCLSEPLLFADQLMNIHYMNLLMGDQLAISTPEIINIYANTWKIYPSCTDHHLFKCSSGFVGHLSLAMVCWLHGLKVEKAFIKKGKLLDQAPLSNESIYNALCEDAAGRHSIWDERLIQASKN